VDATDIHTHTEQITEKPAALVSHLNGTLLATEHMHDRMSLCGITSIASKSGNVPPHRLEQDEQ